MFKGLTGPDGEAPTTPMEAYRRAEWFSLMRTVALCDALLDECPVPEVCPGPTEEPRRRVTDTDDYMWERAANSGIRQRWLDAARNWSA